MLGSPVGMDGESLGFARVNRRVARPRPAPEARPLKVGDRLLDLLAAVHHEGPVLYFFRGDGCTVGGQRLEKPSAVVARTDADVTIVGGDEAVELLMLQGRPIGEPVVQHGPFVMNSR
ncbi:MAG: pirin-like C-terminal cupin domain-containing protein, partial [Polyangiaceae bacterium]